LRHLHTVSIVAAPFYIPTSKVQGSSPTFILFLSFFVFFKVGLFVLFYGGHADGYQAISSCGFDFHFTTD
jgi:hypothetical protein